MTKPAQLFKYSHKDISNYIRDYLSQLHPTDPNIVKDSNELVLFYKKSWVSHTVMDGFPLTVNFIKPFQYSKEKL